MNQYTSNSIDALQYGVGDATYRAAGELEGITRLVDRFYTLMDTLPEAAALRAMHPQDLSESRRKLVFFLSGWMGGPKLFAEHYGGISLPVAHSHLPIDEAGKLSWLHCMQSALEVLNYPQAFREYLLAKLATPAESIRLMAEYQRGLQGHEHSLGKSV